MSPRFHTSKSLNIRFCTGTYISVLELVFLYWDIYFCSGIYIFCTGIYIFLYWNIHISVLEYIFLYWNIRFCTGIHIFVLELNIFLYWNTRLCAGIYIFVLEYIFLYWNLYLCTGIHIFVLEYIFLYWNLYFCTGTYIFVLELIFLYWNIYSCTGTYIFVLPLWATVYVSITKYGKRCCNLQQELQKSNCYLILNLNNWYYETQHYLDRSFDSLITAEVFILPTMVTCPTQLQMDFLNKLLQEITIAYSTVQKNIELQLHERFQERKFFPSNKKCNFFLAPH